MSFSGVGCLPDGKLEKELALLLRAPRSRAKYILESHITVDAKSVGDRLDSIGSEGASVFISGSRGRDMRERGEEEEGRLWRF